MLHVGGNKQDFVLKIYLNIYQVFTEWQYDLKCTISFTVFHQKIVSTKVHMCQI